MRALLFCCLLSGAVAKDTNWQVSRVCIANRAGFVLHWDATDEETASTLHDSGNYPVGQTRCQDLSGIAGVADGHRVRVSAHAVAGKTRGLYTVLYNASSTYTATYTCSGTTLDYSCPLDGYDDCDEVFGGPDSSSAAGDWTLRTMAGKGGYGGHFTNWAGNLRTCAPRLFPANDAELRGYLAYAARRGYKVRVVGATHSSTGLVTEEGHGSENVAVISLGRYHLEDSAWCPAGDFCVDAAARAVRANAGRSWLDLYAQIRPDGWFVPTQTAGYFFSIGGTVLNTVHGGVYGASFVQKYVSRMRVMLWNGTVRVIEGGEVRSWRGSFGLLGVLTAVEMEVIRRGPGFDMFTVQSDYVEWSEENFWRFVAEDAGADLDLSSIPAAAGMKMRKDGKYGEFFLDFLTDGSDAAVSGPKFRTLGVVWTQPEHPEVNFTKAQLQAQYASKEASAGAVTREDGAGKIPIVNQFLSGLNVGGLTNEAWIASALAGFTYLGESVYVNGQRQSVDDGYWVQGAPEVTIAAYFLPFKDAFPAFDYQRSMILARKNTNSTDCFRFNQPAEYRFVRVTDDALLQSVPAGEYLVTEMLGFTDAAPGRDSWERAYAEVECDWLARGARPHLAKYHSFGEDADGVMRPAQPCVACEWFSDEQKSSFEAVRQRYDPDGLFNTGYAARVLLQPCPAGCPAKPACAPRGQPACAK